MIEENNSSLIVVINKPIGGVKPRSDYSDLKSQIKGMGADVIISCECTGRGILAYSFKTGLFEEFLMQEYLPIVRFMGVLPKSAYDSLGNTFRLALVKYSAIIEDPKIPNEIITKVTEALVQLYPNKLSI